MTSIKGDKKIGNVLLFFDFDRLVTDAELDDVFYAPKERVSSTALSTAKNHPLHPEFLPQIPARRGLLAAEPKLPLFDRVSLVRTQQERVTEHWQNVRKHMAYKQLMADLNAQEAYRIFMKFQRRLSSAAGYKHIYAEFRFVQISVWHVGTALANRGWRVSRAPTSKHRHAAIGHIDALLKDIWKRGARFDDHARTLRLMQSLESLKDVLSAQTRRPREDDAKPFRDFNIQLTRALLAGFGVASPEIVKHLARAAGSTLNDRTIESHIEAERGRYIAA